MDRIIWQKEGAHLAATKVLVTGAGGFIGSHLVELLVREGYAVRALIRYTSDYHQGNLHLLSHEISQEIEVARADLRDAEAIADAAKGMDTIFHLGAIISIPYSYQHPEETVSVNVVGTLNILQAMRQHGIRRGVIVSTSEVYGSAQYVPIDKKHPLQPQSPYSATKIAAESLSISFQRSFSTPVVVVRPFNTYGPRQSARAVIPTIISQALTRDVVSLGSIHTTRDYTFVADTARGMLLAAQSESGVGRAINLGSGRSVMIGEIAEKIIQLVGRLVTVSANDGQRLRSEAIEELPRVADNRLAAALLGWRPDVTLEAG